MVVAIGKLLDAGEFVAAQQTATRAAKRYADHAWLKRADQVLNPGRSIVTPGRDPGRDRKQELEWLRDKSGGHRGKWVALHEGRLLASAETFEELIQMVPAADLESRPLIHHVE